MHVPAGLGDQSVEAIIAAYPTAQALWGAYRTAIHSAIAAGRNGTAVARALLAEIPLPSGAAKVGMVRSAKVYDLLFANHANLGLS